jgi:tripartite-type tricarboxylate transporter receptor subunit TctC
MEASMIERAAAWIVTACMVAVTPALAADPWPTRPVTMICPFPPGISTDLLTRALATALTNALGQQFVLENRPGANGNIGAGAAAKAAPDGYTLLVATLGPTVANRFMYKSMSYDSERAFAPVALLGSSPLINVCAIKTEFFDGLFSLDWLPATDGRLCNAFIFCSAGSTTSVFAVLRIC